MSRKGLGALAIILIVAGVIVIGGWTWYYLRHSNANQTPQLASPQQTTSNTTPSTEWQMPSSSLVSTTPSEVMQYLFGNYDPATKISTWPVTQADIDATKPRASSS